MQTVGFFRPRHFPSGAMRLMAAWLLCAAPLAAFAASFDCAKAGQPVERAICADPKLSMLDESLDKAYRAALARPDDGTGRLPAEQRAWLSRRAPDGQVLDTASLIALYQERIDQLKALPAFPAPDQPVEEPVIELTKVSPTYDFSLRLMDVCESTFDSSPCRRGQLLVRCKGQSTPIQHIDLPKVSLEPQIVIGDFNFDGQEDFAIKNGDTGSYNSPSYDVFLFDAGHRRFVYNEPLTTLIAQTMGMFAIDPARKWIQTDNKGGCCHHETTTYRIVRDRPEPVAVHSETLVADGTRLEIVDETIVNGRWQTRRRYEAVKP